MEVTFRGTLSDEGAVRARFEGEADDAALAAVERLLARTHAEALRLGVDEVTIDLTQLGFMSPTCFKCFVTWIGELQTHAPAPYKVTFRSSPSLPWQKRSLHALRCIAVELITVTEV